jgi:hypothetical protein
MMELKLVHECDFCDGEASARFLMVNSSNGVCVVDVDVTLQQVDLECECGAIYSSGDFELETTQEGTQQGEDKQ